MMDELGLPGVTEFGFGTHVAPEGAPVQTIIKGCAYPPIQFPFTGKFPDWPFLREKAAGAVKLKSCAVPDRVTVGSGLPFEVTISVPARGFASAVGLKVTL
jgi:hypothetical protein